MARIGFVGLGNMGGPMLSNLLTAGHQLSAFDLVESALGACQTSGCDGSGVCGRHDSRAPNISSACCLPAGT